MDLDRSNDSMRRPSQGRIRTAIQAMDIPSNGFSQSGPTEKRRIQTPLIYPADTEGGNCKESRLITWF